MQGSNSVFINQTQAGKYQNIKQRSLLFNGKISKKSKRIFNVSTLTKTSSCICIQNKARSDWDKSYFKYFKLVLAKRPTVPSGYWHIPITLSLSITQMPKFTSLYSIIISPSFLVNCLFNSPTDSSTSHLSDSKMENSLSIVTKVNSIMDFT